ncbi:MAG TPA: zinc ribbon domain-containing protein [Crinalium sp.]|jgi:hypothetical protein
MLECPRCHQPVGAQAIACPHCHTVLKAHGHPGIMLYRAKGDEYLCDTCTYHEDDTCNFPQRPYAKECTLYQDKTQPTTVLKAYTLSRSSLVKTWLRRNGGWLVLLGLIVVSIAMVLSGR